MKLVNICAPNVVWWMQTLLEWSYSENSCFKWWLRTLKGIIVIWRRGIIVKVVNTDFGGGTLCYGSGALCLSGIGHYVLSGEYEFWRWDTMLWKWCMML